MLHEARARDYKVDNSTVCATANMPMKLTVAFGVRSLSGQPYVTPLGGRVASITKNGDKTMQETLTSNIVLTR